MKTPYCLVSKFKIRDMYFVAILKTYHARTTQPRYSHDTVACNLWKLLPLLAVLTTKTGPLCPWSVNGSFSINFHIIDIYYIYQRWGPYTLYTLPPGLVLLIFRLINDSFNPTTFFSSEIDTLFEVSCLGYEFSYGHYIYTSPAFWSFITLFLNLTAF